MSPWPGAVACRWPRRAALRILTSRPRAGTLATQRYEPMVTSYGKLIRFPRQIRMTLPAGSRLWNVEGIPVAEIPSGRQDCAVLAFDAPNPRPFSRSALVSRGKAIARADWDRLVNACRSVRPPSPPPGRR